MLLLIPLFLFGAIVFAQADVNAADTNQITADSNSIETDHNALIQDSNAGQETIISYQDQNIGAEGWTSCSSASPQTLCINTSPIDSANTLQWAFYNCANASKITEGSKCYVPGQQVCTDKAYCPLGKTCQFWYITSKNKKLRSILL